MFSNVYSLPCSQGQSLYVGTEEDDILVAVLHRNFMGL